jgi:flavin reductase (DIM6/NTAB) family NADH-FMN oxidoreductase RutF
LKSYFKTIPMKDFKEIRPEQINDNVFKLLDQDWMLVTAGRPGDYNTMTASWGHMGILWNLPVAIAYVRPQRHTFGFATRYEDYTLSFFTEAYRDALDFCGSHSGRDTDKARETGLTPVETGRGNVTFREARMVLECRKIYQDDLKKEHFLVPEVARRNYPIDDFHRFFMGQIVHVWTK